MKGWCFVVSAVLAAHVFAVKGELVRSLHGTKGFSVTCDTENQLSLVRSYEDNENFNFLIITKILGKEIKVLVSAESVDDFTKFLTEHKIRWNVFVQDVAKEVHKEYVRNEFAKKQFLRRANAEIPVLRHFARYNEIQSYLSDLAQSYGDIAKVIEIGSSYEGRPIVAIKISSGSSDDKPAILIDAGIHAREWAAPATALYAIHELIVNNTNSGLYENLDWYIIPSLNPDGYEYTHTTQRFWRKTRSRNAGTYCYGTDPNRNFEYMWMTTGASSSPCSDIYAGKKAFSEKETASLRDFVLAHKDSIKAYLTLHSYGQYMLHPWGFTSDLPENEPELRSVAVEAERAIASVRGTRYEIGSSTNVLYAAAGGSDDWVMGVAGVPLSYTIELPPGGSVGFDLPPSEIEIVGRETFKAFEVFARYVVKTHTRNHVRN